MPIWKLRSLLVRYAMQCITVNDAAAMSRPCICSAVLTVVLTVCLVGANIGLVLISQVAWDSGLFESETLRVPRPLQVAFPAYEDDVMIKVIP